MASDLGSYTAQEKLGDFYMYGYGVPVNQEQAAEYYRLAAGNKNVSAMLKLAECYRYGYGVEQSDKKADMWVRRAEAQKEE